MLTANERITNIEAAIVGLTNKYNVRATDDELEAVRSEVFDIDIQSLFDTVTILEETIKIVRETISTAQGK